MNLSPLIHLMEGMKTAEIIGPYAIGGAVGATFYLEPVVTMDIDVFITVTPRLGQLILNLEPIFTFLKTAGCSIRGEYVIIETWPVQFLPPPTPLVTEALKQARSWQMDGVTVPVFSGEHLAAIALETGRPKDQTRLLQFFEAEVLDIPRFESIVNSNNLTAKWQQFKKRFIDKTDEI